MSLRVRDVTLKLRSCLAALRRTEIKVFAQSNEFLDRGSRAGGAMHEADSLFLPGERVTFTGGREAALTLLRKLVSLEAIDD